MQLRDDARAALAPWLRHPGRRLRREIVTLRQAVLPHPGNNQFRKLTVLVLLGTWVALTLGLRAPGQAVPEWLYTALTVIVFAIVGRQWGLEIVAYPGIRIVESEDE